MSEYLKALGLTEKDVVMQNMDPAQVLAAFDAGIGDFAGIWPMWLYIGMERGNKLIYQRRRERGPHAHPRGRQGLL